MHSFKQKKSQKGVSLIELMVASALGVVVIMGVSDGMMSMSRSSRVQIEDNSLQEKGVVGLDYITAQFRGAIGAPCDRFSAAETTGTLDFEGGDPQLEDLVKGRGIRLAQTATVTIAGADKPVLNDGITYLESGNRRFLGNTRITYDSGSLVADDNFEQGTKDYVITNCQSMDIFRGTSAGDRTLTFATGSIRHRYEANSSTMIAPLSRGTITVANNELRKTNNPPIGNAAGPLMEGVEAMRLLFGVDTDGDNVVDRQMTAEQVESENPEAIISAEVLLLIRADRPNPSNTKKPYTLQWPKSIKSDGTWELEDISFSDQVPRKIVTRSAVFRNKSKLL
ncbi:MAG: hypothetical protein CR974_02545 [Gammaproteobacteria bacterium]|nr:MAG: hypothetical protein CR974_02545 [Gammaproteobacteria bacterium]